MSTKQSRKTGNGFPNNLNFFIIFILGQAQKMCLVTIISFRL